MTDNPLAKLGDLTKPATMLIEKISDAVAASSSLIKSYVWQKQRPKQVEFKLNLRSR